MAINKTHYYRKIGRDSQYKSLTQIETRSATTDDPQSFKCLLEEVATDTTYGQIDNYEREARVILEKAGLPTEFIFQIENGGKSVITKSVENIRLTPEWHAAHIIYYAHLTRDHADKNDTMNAVRAAMRLQHHVEQLFIRHIEYAARVGQKQLKAVAVRKYTDAHKQNWERLREELPKQDDTLKGPRKGRAITRAIAFKTGHPEGAIRAHFKSINKLNKLG